ncbi:MAG: hypothetical protein ACKVT0_23960 [Planctomycetaceae bacterium]
MMKLIFHLLIAAGAVVTFTGSNPKPPRAIKVLIPEREFATEGCKQALRVTFGDLNLLKVINMDPVTADAPQRLPKWMKNLDGKRIRITGVMVAPFEATGLKEFVLGADEPVVSFGRIAKVYDVFQVTLAEGQTTHYTELNALDVEGVFHIDPMEIDGELVRMYSIDDAVIVKK